MGRCARWRAIVWIIAAASLASPPLSAQGGGAPAITIKPLVLGWDGAGGRTVPNGAATTPHWSHDGALVAFASDATNLTSPGDPPHGITATPDVYVVDVQTGHNLWVSAPDTSVSPLAAAYPLGFAPAPDGSGHRVLAFWSNARRLAGEGPGAPDDSMTDPAGDYDLFLARIQPDGAGAPALVAIERLTSHGAAVDVTSEIRGRGAWAPDGARLVFVSHDERDGLELAANADADLFILDVATGAISRLTHAVGDAVGPVWSRDGLRIAFTFFSDPATDLVDQDRDGVADLGPDQNGVADVLLLDVATRVVTRVTDTGAGEAAPAVEDAEALAFSPDGTVLLFSHGAELPGLPPVHGVRQIAAFDIASGSHTAISGSAATLGDQPSTDAVFAPIGAPARAGTVIALVSRANNLPGLEGTNTQREAQLVLWDAAGTLTLLSRTTSGGGATHASEGSLHPAIAPVSIDRQLAVAFDSDASDLGGAAVAPGTRTIFLAKRTSTEGDLRLRAVWTADGTSLAGRTVSALRGAPFDVGLEVENEGTRLMSGVDARVTLPAGFTLDAWDPPQAAVSIVSGDIVWTIGDVDAGQTTTIRLTLTAPSSAQQAVFAAEIVASDPDVDSTPDNGLSLEDDLAQFIVDVESLVGDDAFRGTIGQAMLIPYERLLANDAPGATFVRVVGPTSGPSWSLIDQSVVGGESVLVSHTGAAAETVTFQYEVDDAQGRRDIATVTISVDNRAPFSVDQTFLVVPGQTLELRWADIIAAPGNGDPDGDAITLGYHGLPDASTFGTLSYFGGAGGADLGGLRFTPHATYTGGLELTYGVVDVVDFGGAERASFPPPSTIRFVTATAAADLSVTATSNTSAEVGSHVSLGVAVGNAGPAGASATVRLQLPSSVEFTGAVQGFDPTTGLWQVPPLQPGQVASIAIPARITAEGQGAVSLEIVSATAPDPDLGNNRAIIEVTGFVREADVSVDLVFAPASVLPGEPITVTVVVSNAGRFAATNVVLTGLDYLLGTHVIDSVTAFQGSCAPIAPGQPLQCALGALGVGDSTTVAVVARPTAALFPDEILPEVSVGVRARVSATERDPAAANNEINRAFSVRRPRADVSVAISVSPAPPATVLPGEAVTITAVVSNVGPDAAHQVVLTGFDYLLSTHTAGSVTASQGTCTAVPTPAPFQCAVGTIAAGGSATLTIVATPTMLVFPDEQLSEVSVGVRAMVSATEQDPVSGNNEAYRAFGVRRPRADVRVSITAPALVSLGEPARITALIANVGPDAATGLMLTGLDYVIGTHTIDSATPTQGTCAPVVGSSLTCALGSLGVGSFAEVVIIARPTAAVFAGVDADQISVGARLRVAGEQQDPSPENNEAYRAFDAGRPNLVTTKAVVEDARGPDPLVTEGGTVEFVLQVANRGRGTTSAHTIVTDVLPAGLTFDAALSDPSCTANGQVVTCAVARPIIAHEAVGIWITTRVGPDVAAPGQVVVLTNVATATTAGARMDGDETSNPVTIRVLGQPESDLRLTLTSSAASVQVEQPVTFQATVTNHGPSPTAHTVVQVVGDVLARFVNVSTATSSGVCAMGPPTSCAVGDLPVGGSATVTITATPPAGLFVGNNETSLRFGLDATVSSDVLDPSPGNEAAALNVDVTRQPFFFEAALTAERLPAPGPIAPGDRVRLTARVTNTGTVAATTPSVRLTFTDALGMTSVASLPVGWACTPSPALTRGTAGTPGVWLICRAESIDSGATVSFEFDARVLRVPAAGTIEPRLDAGSPTCDPAGSGNAITCTSVFGSIPVVAAPTATVGTALGALTVTTSTGQFTAMEGLPASEVPAPPMGIRLPYGALRFTITGVPVGGAADITIATPAAVDGYWKPSGGVWAPFVGAAPVPGGVVVTIVDGGAGDADGVANGVIADPGAVGVEAFSFRGFYEPVDNRPAVNRVRAGQAIPIKFSLGGNRGLDVFLPGFPRVTQVGCGGRPLVGPRQRFPIDDFRLRYDPRSERYSFVWKTSRDLAPGCWRLTLRFRDGARASALFEVKR